MLNTHSYYFFSYQYQATSYDAIRPRYDEEITRFFINSIAPALDLSIARFRFRFGPD